jgi:hypothetical protein
MILLSYDGGWANMNNNNGRNRKSIRLKNYDYSQAGFYFITICTQNRLHLFGEIINDEMVLNDAGRMIDEIWHEIPIYYDGFKIHQFIVMPNHIHGIIEIVGADHMGNHNQGRHGGLPLRGWGILCIGIKH